MRKLLLLFVLVPALELALLIEVGSRIGTAWTLLVLALSGSVGAFVAWRQGLGALRAAQDQMRRGELPAGPMVDGALILVGAVLLIAPGLVTDALGFLLLLPSVRGRLKTAMADQFRRGVEARRIQVYAAGLGRAPIASEPYPSAAEETYKIH